MSCCPGCQKVFRTEAALCSHQRQTKKTRCRRFYASSSHGSQPSDLDHISDVDMMEDFGFDTSSEARIPTDPQGDYFGNYDDDYDPSHAHWTSPPLSPSIPFNFNIDSDPILPPRLAGVRLGAGSGVRCPNLNLHLQVRFRHPANPNPNKRFRFKRFGLGSHPVQCQKFPIWPILITNFNSVQKKLVKRLLVNSKIGIYLHPSLIYSLKSTITEC
jgi:hypothetical protein